MAQEEFLDDPMPDIIEQWRYYFSVLAPQPDDQILDVGCNTAEAERLLLREYHNIGKVIGLEKDPKRYDYALSKLQKDGNPAQIELKLGDALDLPFPDSHFDRAFSVDVLEWVKEPVKALQEIHRVLKPSGTATIVHSDFDTQVFSCDDKELCRQIVHAFTDSGPNGQLGRELYRLCSLAGFHSVRPMIYPLINTEWLPNLYGYKAVQTMIEWFAKTGRVAESDLSRWLADIENTAQAKLIFLFNQSKYLHVRQMTNLDLFKSEWTFTRGLTIELLDSLTDAELSEPPGRDLGPFWKQFRHVGRLQECYQDALNTGRIKFDYDHKRYRGGCSRDALKNYLQELDRELLGAIEQVDWNMSINWDGDNIGVFQHLMRMASHEILHHGQWILYARLMELKLPPSWKAWGV